MGWFSKVGSFVKNNIHGILDVAGMIPGVGAVADLANAAIYAAEGDWGNAALSAVSAVPGVGDTIAMANKGLKVAKGVNTAIKGGKSLKGILKVGGKSILKAIKGKAKVGAKFLKKLNPKALFGKLKNGFKKVFLEAKCFTGDTLVYTEKGMQPIQEVKVGDLIYARNEETGEIGLKRVERTSETEAHTIYSITIDNKEVIRTTAYHGFYTEELEWVNSINLKVGDRLVSEERIKSVTEIEKTRYDEPVSVYNFVVEDWHTYFVGEEKICVHNSVRHIINKVKDKVKDAYTKVKDTVKKVMSKGDPVDMVTGAVFSENIDFELPGIIPLKWERKYYSDSRMESILGHKTFLNYGTEIYESREERKVVLVLPDGRPLVFYDTNMEEPIYNRTEKLAIEKIEKGFIVFYYTDRLYYRYENRKQSSNLYNLIEIGDEAGHRITLGYEKNKLNEIIDSAGRKLEIVCDEFGKILQVKYGVRKLVTYEYNTNGNLIKIIDALGQKKTIEYKGNLMIKATTKDNFSFFWEYDGEDSNAKCIHTWGDEESMEYFFEYSDGVSYSTSSIGNREIVYYNESNLITKHIDAEGNITKYEYNEYEEQTAIIKEMGIKTLFKYNEKGYIVNSIQPSGANFIYEYDDNCRLIKVTYPNGGIKNFFYNISGSIIKIVYPDYSEEEFYYNEKGIICSIKNVGGGKIEFNYDKWNNLSEVIQADGSKQYFEYDEYGNCIKMKNALGAEHLLVYDDLNRIVKENTPNGNISHIKYNAYDKVIEVKDDKQTVNFEYTWSGRLKKRKELKKSIEYIYDSQERIKSIVNEAGFAYKFNYDGNGNIIEEIGFDGESFRYLYDKVGRITKVIQPNGNQKEIEYDYDGNIIHIKYSDGFYEIFKYNSMGSLIQAKNNNSIIDFELDIMGRIKKTLQDGQVIEYEHNKFGQRTCIKSSKGAFINQEYNIVGDVSRICANSNSSINWEADMNYNALGQEISRNMSGETRSKWEYDKTGRPTLQIVKGYNERSNIRKYEWNRYNQLETIETNNGIVNYGYDIYGNMECSRINNTTVFRSLDEIGNLYETKQHKDRQYGNDGKLLKSKHGRYEYDILGNLIKKVTNEGVWEYLYYNNGLMSKVIRPDNKEVIFKYDALGRRIEKVFNDKKIKFLWDGNVLLHEWEEEKEDIKNSVTWIFDEKSFSPFAKITENGVYSIISDHLGTPIEMYNRTGEKIWYRELDIYGRITKEEGDRNSCCFKFPGQYEDQETGLYYNRFRYYSSEDGIYTQQDPIGVLGSNPTLYGYVYDTNRFADPLGLKQTPLYGSKNQTVYGIFDVVDGKAADKPFYVGITENFENRSRQHQSPAKGQTTARYDPAKHQMSRLDIPNNGSLDYAEARAWEQTKIEEYGTKGEYPGNRQNSFDKTRADDRGKTYKKEYDKIQKNKGVH